MDWEAREKEKQKALIEERERLLAMSEAEAATLPVSERYQRNRYKGEIEAAEWLAGVRRQLPVVTSEPVKTRYKKNSKMMYKDD